MRMIKHYGQVPVDEEFAEFDTDEASFDAMMTEAEPAELVAPPAGTTTTIRQSDETVFRVTVPVGGFLSVDTSTDSRGGGRLTAGPGRLSVHHRSSTSPESLAS